MPHAGTGGHLGDSLINVNAKREDETYEAFCQVALGKLPRGSVKLSSTWDNIQQHSATFRNIQQRFATFSNIHHHSPPFSNIQFKAQRGSNKSRMS